MTDKRVAAAAQALCKQASEDAGVGYEEFWKLYRDQFISDAKAALKAADAIERITVRDRVRTSLDQQVERLSRANQMLEETVKIYRQKHGVAGASNEA